MNHAERKANFILKHADLYEVDFWFRWMVDNTTYIDEVNG
jgi:hypothetical protein